MYKKYIYKYLNIFSLYVTKNLYLNNFSCILPRSRKNKHSIQNIHTTPRSTYAAMAMHLQAIEILQLQIQRGGIISCEIYSWYERWKRKHNRIIVSSFFFFFWPFPCSVTFSTPCLVFFYKKVVIDSLLFLAESINWKEMNFTGCSFIFTFI